MKRGNEGVHGETIAKFEFAEAGWNPYSHYYDQSKVDLVLRRERGEAIQYRDVQVKFGRLYDYGAKWETDLFSLTSWRFFDPNAFAGAHDNLFVAYVLSDPNRGYQGDIFVFVARDFHDLIGRSVPVKDNARRKVYLSRAKKEVDPRESWYCRQKSAFTALSDDVVINVTKYRRNFAVLD